MRSRSGTGVIPHERSDGSIVPPFAGITRIRFGGSGLVSPLSAARKRLPGLYAAILPTMRSIPSTARASMPSSKR